MRLVASYAILCVLNFVIVQGGIGPLPEEPLFDAVKDSELVRKDPALVKKVLKKVKRSGCGVNICFALDGSAAVGLENFQVQKEFVNLLATITGSDESTKFAASVYGLVPDTISKLTQNGPNFLLDVNETQFPAAPITFINNGLGVCLNQLDDFEARNDANKLLLLADGLSNFGDFPGPIIAPSLPPTPIPENIEICAVAVGFASTRGFQGITGDPELVFKVPEWSQVLNILSELVEQICSREKVARKSCPCRCQKKARAFKQCRKKMFIKCTVFACGSKKFQCCDKRWS